MDNLINILRMKDSSTSAMCAYNKMLKCQLLGIDDIMLMPMKKEEAPVAESVRTSQQIRQDHLRNMCSCKAMTIMIS